MTRKIDHFFQLASRRLNRKVPARNYRTSRNRADDRPSQQTYTAARRKTDQRCSSMTLTNAQMIPCRFARMAKARRLRRKIEETFAKGGVVQIATQTKYTNYHPKHAQLFKYGRFSTYVARGKNWDCIDFCQISFATPERSTL